MPNDPITAIGADAPPDLPPTDPQGLEKEPILVRAVATMLAVWLLSVIGRALADNGITFPLPDGIDPQLISLFAVAFLTALLLAGWARLTAWAPASVQAVIREAYKAGIEGLARPTIRK